jgi:hypothetical protein
MVAGFCESVCEARGAAKQVSQPGRSEAECRDSGPGLRCRSVRATPTISAMAIALLVAASFFGLAALM